MALERRSFLKILSIGGGALGVSVAAHELGGALEFGNDEAGASGVLPSICGYSPDQIVPESKFVYENHFFVDAAFKKSDKRVVFAPVGELHEELGFYQPYFPSKNRHKEWAAGVIMAQRKQMAADYARTNQASV